MVKNKLTPKRIIKILEDNKKEISKYSVIKIGLFGSYLKEKYNRKSDLDFLVEFKNPTFDNYMELKFLLERLFGKKVDLVIENKIKKPLVYIKNEAIYARF